MKTLLFICLLFLTGCSDRAESFNEAIIDLDQSCNGPTKVKIHIGNWSSYIEFSCDDIDEIKP